MMYAKKEDKDIYIEVTTKKPKSMQYCDLKIYKGFYEWCSNTTDFTYLAIVAFW